MRTSSGLGIALVKQGGIGDFTLPALNIVENEANSDRDTARTRHVSRRFHCVRNGVSSKDHFLKWVPTEEQMADFLTKSGDFAHLTKQVCIDLQLPKQDRGHAPKKTKTKSENRKTKSRQNACYTLKERRATQNPRGVTANELSPRILRCLPSTQCMFYIHIHHLTNTNVHVPKFRTFSPSANDPLPLNSC